LTLRKFAIAAIAASVMLGTSACTFMSPVASRIVYAPADGHQVDLQSLKLRNFVYVTNGEKSALTGSIVNSGTTSSSLTITYTDAAVAENKTVTITVAAGQKLDLGYNGGSALGINLGGKAGDIVSIQVAEGSGEAVLFNIPVLDERFEYFKPAIDSLGSVEPSAE
jgi:hypothetical protein